MQVMEDRMTKEKRNAFLISVLLFIATGTVTGAAGYFYERENIVIVRNIIMALLGCGVVIYLLEYAKIVDDLDYDNAKNKKRFYVLYLISLLLSVLFPMLPAPVWPYLAIFVALSLFSNEACGAAAGTLLLMITVLTQNSDSLGYFFMYFMCGYIGIVLFRQMDETFKVGLKVFVSLTMLFVCLSANYVLFVNDILSLQHFLLPIINVFTSLLLLSGILKYFSSVVIHRYWERYVDLNDPECSLLVSLKEIDKDEYYQAIHTAYLCDRVAKKLEIDDVLTKAGGYYHRIGRLKGENSWENMEQVCDENDFPPKLSELLNEYSKKENGLVSKEAVVLLFSDTIILSIIGLMKKDSKMELDYHLLIDTIFKKKLGSGIIDESIISMGEINRMKKMFMEEALYYDFLR